MLSKPSGTAPTSNFQLTDPYQVPLADKTALGLAGENLLTELHVPMSVGSISPTAGQQQQMQGFTGGEIARGVITEPQIKICLVIPPRSPRGVIPHCSVTLGFDSSASLPAEAPREGGDSVLLVGLSSLSEEAWTRGSSVAAAELPTNRATPLPWQGVVPTTWGVTGSVTSPDQGCCWEVSSCLLTTATGQEVDDLAFYRDGQLCALINPSDTSIDGSLTPDVPAVGFKSGGGDETAGSSSFLVMLPRERMLLSPTQVWTNSHSLNTHFFSFCY